MKNNGIIAQGLLTRSLRNIRPKIVEVLAISKGMILLEVNGLCKEIMVHQRGRRIEDLLENKRSDFRSVPALFSYVATVGLRPEITVMNPSINDWGVLRF